MNEEKSFSGWVQATDFIRKINPLFDYHFETNEEKVVFMSEILQWVFDKLFGIEDNLILFMIGPKRIYLRAMDDTGKEYAVHAER